MNARNLGLSQAEAAYIAEISQRTGQRIEAGTHRPNRGTVRESSQSRDLLGVKAAKILDFLREYFAAPSRPPIHSPNGHSRKGEAPLKFPQNWGVGGQF
jgi:transcriptional regulator with XRE-family HTH domain